MEVWYFWPAGLFFVVLGVFLLIRARLWRARAVRVPGRITGVRGTEGQNGINYMVNYRFTTKEGNKIKSSAGAGSSTDLKDGAHVEVLYDPRKPTSSYIDVKGMRGGWAGWVLVGIGGIAWFSAAMVWLFGPEGVLST